MEALRKLTTAKGQVEAFTKDSDSFRYSTFSELRNESLHLFRVERDGNLLELPDILLVRGDSVYVENEKEFQRICKLAEPCLIGTGTFPRFVMLHTSKFVPFLEDCLSRKESKTNWIDSKIDLMRRCMIYLMLLAFLVAAVRKRCPEFFGACWYFFIFYPVPWVFLLRCYASSRIIVLWELLKHSQNPYDDIDEFDENEPPPTIDLYVPLRRILHTMYLFVREQIVGFDLCDNLSVTSFVAYTDRCGTLCDKYPTVAKVLVFCESTVLLEPDVILDTVPFEGGNAGFQFEDRGWVQFQASLRPLGLCTSLMGSCRLAKKDFYHKLDANKYEWMKDSPADQICFCSLGKVLGFQPSDIAGYQPLKYFLLDCSKQKEPKTTGKAPSNSHSSITSNNSKGIQGAPTNSSVISVKSFKKDSQIFIICEGNPDALLPFATKYWTGTNVVPLDDKIGKKIVNFTNTCSNSDTYNSVFGFKLLVDEALPISSGIWKGCLEKGGAEMIDSGSSEFASITELLQGLVLVGILGLSFEPKEDISAFIDDLEQAGIRFVYFSPHDQKSTKAFGDRLGLETDWNSCILLNEPNYNENGKSFPSRGYSDRSDINARLPQGPQQIRHHLENVDDIPLHVSLFANSYDNVGTEIRELFDIFHEQGETVCLVGNCLNLSNFFLFRSADVAIGMEPSYAHNSDRPAVGASNSCTSMHLANALVSTFCSLDGLPFKSSPYILTEIIREGRSLLDVSFQIISYIIVVNMSFCISVALFHLHIPNLWGIIPIVIVSVMFLGNTHDESIMRFLPAKKNEDETKIYLFNPRRLVAYLLIKCAAFIVCYSVLADYLQIVLLQLLSSAFYLHRNISLRCSFLSQLNYMWLSFIVVFACCTGKLWLGWRIFVAFPVNLFINELCKKHDRVNWLKTQKRLKLEFNTRLGMHSPV